jgi:hypothetical protein
MNWKKYKFFTVCSGIDIYHHFIWVDGAIFACHYDQKTFFIIFNKDPNNSFTYEHITFFPLEKEFNNYKNAVKYYNYIQPPLGSNYIDISEYIKKIMERETNLDKILQSI